MRLPLNSYLNTWKNIGMNIDIRKLGHAISEFRKLRGLTQVDLAEAVGMSSNNIARLERGEIGCSVKNLNKLAEVLDVPASFLPVMATNSPGEKDPAGASALQKVQAAVKTIVEIKAKSRTTTGDSGTARTSEGLICPHCGQPVSKAKHGLKKRLMPKLPRPRHVVAR